MLKTFVLSSMIKTRWKIKRTIPDVQKNATFENGVDFAHKYILPFGQQLFCIFSCICPSSISKIREHRPKTNIFCENTGFCWKMACKAYFSIFFKNPRYVFIWNYFFILIQPLPRPFQWILWLKQKISRKAIKISKMMSCIKSYRFA